MLGVCMIHAQKSAHEKFNRSTAKMAYEIEDARCVHQTDKAILVEAPDFDEPVWIPQSQITKTPRYTNSGPRGCWWCPTGSQRRRGGYEEHADNMRCM